MIANLDLTTIIISLVIGSASGAVGAFIILRRMALVGDALSHVALPGIALALAYAIDPFWGVLVSCLVAAVIVWAIGQKTKLYFDTLIGLLFTFSLAVGILMIPDVEILESLFGGFEPLSFPLFIFVTVTGLCAIVLTFLLSKKFLFSIVSSDLAHVEVPKSRMYSLVLFLIFSFVVALGIKLVGTLLMGALTIIPASISKNISRSMAGYIVMSSFLGGLIALFGVVVASRMQFLPGPTIILSGIGLFVISLFFVRKN